MTAATVTVVCDLFDGSGAAITHGTAWFAPSVTLTDAADGMFVPQAPVPAEFRSRVSPTVGLLPTDDPSVLPSGWAWGVQFAYIAGSPGSYNFFLPAGPASFTAAAGTPCTLGWGTTAALTSLPNGSRVQLSGGSVPSAFGTTATYYVVDSSGTTVSLATSRGGSAIASAGSGSGDLTVVQYNLSALSPVGTATTMAAFAQVPAGDLGGTSADPYLRSIQGTAIAAPTGIATEYLNAQGGWTAPPGTDVISVFGRTGAVVADTGDYTAAQVGAVPAANGTDWLNVVTGYGADPTGGTDSTTAIKDALSAAGPGQVVYAPAGTYLVSSQITLPSLVTLMGDTTISVVENVQDGSGQAGTVLKVSASWSGSGTSVLYLEDNATARTIGGSVLNLTINGISYTSTAIDGIQGYGPVIQTRVNNVAIENMSGWGIRTLIDSGAASNQYPYWWDVDKLMVNECASGGCSLTNMTDATWRDVYVLECGKGGTPGPGWAIVNCDNSHFTDCRAEWCGTSGLHVTGAWYTGTGAGGCVFTGFSTDRNEQNGVLVDATGNSPVTFTGPMLRRDGRNAKSGGGGYSGLAVTSAGLPVIVSGITVFPGIDDDGTGSNSPEYGVSVSSSLAAVIDSGFIQAATQALNIGSGNTYWWTGPGVVTATGTTSSPGGYAGQAAQYSPPYSAEPLASGEALFYRAAFTQQQSLTASALMLTYWTAAKTETVNHVKTITGGAAASGLTYANIGIFTVDGSANLTLAASTGDLHSTLWKSTFTEYNSSLTSGFSKVAGARYAMGLLAVGGTAPSLYGQYVSFAGDAPILAGTVPETTMPSSVSAGSISASAYQIAFQAAVTP